MGWKPKDCPSFIKFLLPPDFADNLPIPPVFVSRYLEGGKTVGNAILVAYDSAKSWPVTIINMGRRYCFKLGWSEFSQDNHLEIGDFLVFWLIGDSTFLVAIYSPSGIEKKIPTTVTTINPTFTGSVFEVEQVNSDSDTATCKFKNGKVKDGMLQAATSVKQLHNPSFTVIINKSNNCRLCLPKSFVNETRILASMRSMVLIDAAGIEWQVKILRRKYGPLGYDLTSGWSSFRKANNIEIGDTCLIQFLRNEGNIIHVKVLNRKGSTRVSRGRNKGQYKTGKMEEERDGLFEAATSVKPLNTLCFKARLGRSSNNIMGLPLWFVRETRLAMRRNTKLKDATGCEYHVRIRQRSCGHGYEMTTGWASFRRAINIEKGDICLFQFFRNEGNIIHVKVIDRKRSKRVGQGQRRGRPQLNKDPRPQ